ncbi:Hypothetical protein OINT_2000573 [Brucella intermedia LMG 3301]|uniref:Uncharacterized protein n=1 Tax=Brucella intermedia LMG 3301 TaxID=641118 RepID=C4WPJ0_9HYPH|nr:Hypothetical protein OINT_2000573 [Brucella intermedia LMG 3301]
MSVAVLISRSGQPLKRKFLKQFEVALKPYCHPERV